MRILWIKVGGLWPLETGGRLRTVHILRELARRHEVVVLTTHGPGDDPDGLAAHLGRGVRVISLPHAAPKLGSGRFARALARSWLSALPVDLWKWRVPALRRRAQQLLADADLCVADFLASVPSVPFESRVPVVFFAHNVEHVIWKRLSEVETRPWRRLPLELEWRKMRRFESRTCRRADLTLAVSEEDGARLAAGAKVDRRRERRPARVRAVPTGVDTSYFAPGGVAESAGTLVFTGSMDWYPNEDAVLHFREAVLPLIRREVPEARLAVVGRNPSRRLLSAAGPDFTVTGGVPDVRPYVAPAAVYVTPLRVGGGTRLKIFEALAMGKAVVSTRVGAEGLPLVPGEHFVEADEPAAFAAAVVKLLRDPHGRRRLGRAGRRLVEQNYSWPQVAREFERHCVAAREGSCA